ncbi:MAG: hypothetical protein CL931_05115 [Deltaproteobacteria bacterium]|nr:hypothetical protein [Deltaproteobacteria bacterium]
MDRARTSKGFTRRVGLLLAFAGAVASLGCATARVSNVDAYEDVPMNRVVPYPLQEALRKRSFTLVIVDRPAVGIEEGMLERPRAQVRRALEDVAVDAGASVIEGALGEPGTPRAEGVRGDSEEREREGGGEADFALATRFAKVENSSVWKKPFKMPWQSDEEVASKPGTCEHTAAVELEVQLIELGYHDEVVRTFSLEHQAEQQTRDLDPACTLPPVTLGVLFEKAIDEALSCLDLPLGTIVAPRGHLTGHRKAPGADRHIYRITLGSGQGIEPGDRIEIRREQRSMSPAGEEALEERVIAIGEVSDEVRPQQSWVAIDPAKASGTILDGDVVRPVLEEGLLSRLTGPDCGEILTEP